MALSLRWSFSGFICSGSTPRRKFTGTLSTILLSPFPSSPWSSFSATRDCLRSTAH
jgi:hypothetical protein